MTCYCAGPYSAAHILLAFLLLFGSPATHSVFFDYGIRYLPLFGLILLVQGYSVHCWSPGRARLRWRAISLVYATWPIYLSALFCAVTRRKLDYLPTPKVFAGGNFVPLAAPQLIVTASLVIGLVRLPSSPGPLQTSLAVTAFALVLVLANSSLCVGIAEGLQFRTKSQPGGGKRLPSTR